MKLRTFAKSTQSAIMQNREHGPPNVSWKKTKHVIVGWFEGRICRNNSNWNMWQPKVLCTFIVCTWLTNVAAACKIKSKTKFILVLAANKRDWVKVWHHSFLRSLLHEGKWPAARLGRFPRAKCPGFPLTGGWVGSRTSVDALYKNVLPCQ